MSAALELPVTPMLARAVKSVPDEGGLLYEPKWDGFRALVARDGDVVELWSRNGRPLTRYFPELIAPLRVALASGAVVDGEVVVEGAHGLDFDLLAQRIHPAASRIERLARETPARFVAFDALAAAGDDLTGRPLHERRAVLSELLARAGAPVHLTPTTTEAARAREWFGRFEGAGLDGVVAKDLEGAYRPGERGWWKVKHARSADCVVGGFRRHKDGEGVGSLLLGLYDGSGVLHHIGVASGFAARARRELVGTLAPLREGALEGHPWADWADEAAHAAARLPGSRNRWTGARDLSWEALRPERVAEVAYEQLQAGRLRHNARFTRWRPDRLPASCTYAQLEVPVPAELPALLGP